MAKKRKSKPKAKPYKDLTGQKISARAIIDQTEAGQVLTVPEREVAAGIMVGEILPKTLNGRGPLVREALIEAMGVAGIDNTSVAELIKGGMEAEHTTILGEFPDWTARHKYLTTALQITKVLGGENIESNLSVPPPVYKSNLKTDGEIIDINKPKSEVIKRRMLANRPTNRKDP